MNRLELIFGRIWAVWALIWFVVTMLVFYIPFLIIKNLPEPRRTKLFISFSQAWMMLYLPGIGCPLTIRGKEHFRKGENYVVICNHNSLMDVPVSARAVPGGNKTIAKMEFARVPLFGMLYQMGSVLVDRKNERSRKESFAKMKQVLAMGLHMCIYPEGTRNLSGEPIKAFHDGAFRLSADTGKKLMPALIFHTQTVLPADKGFFLWPHPLQMHFLEPVELQQGETIEELKNRVYHIMRAYYVSNHG